MFRAECHGTGIAVSSLLSREVQAAEQVRCCDISRSSSPYRRWSPRGPERAVDPGPGATAADPPIDENRPKQPLNTELTVPRGGVMVRRPAIGPCATREPSPMAGRGFSKAS